MSKSSNPKNRVTNIIVNVGDNAKVITDRERTRKKLKKNDKKHLGRSSAEDEIDKPEDCDLGGLTHYSANCIANHLVSAAWSQEPMLRFSRKKKRVYCQGKDCYSGWVYRDCIRFNDWAFRRLGLKYGMKLGLFTEKPDRPKYFIIQNVVRNYDAPAHLHRLGTFTLRKGVGAGEDHDHVCKPGTKTKLGVIGHRQYERYQLSLFESFPLLNDHQLRLWRMRGATDVIIGRFSDITPVPATTGEKLLRVGVPLLESMLRPHTPEHDEFAEALSFDN